MIAQAAVSADLPAQFVVGRNADGRLELLKVDEDGELRHRSQKPSHSDWSPWSSLGGVFQPGVAVGNNANGTLEVFVVDAESHTLKCIRQMAPNSADWSGGLDISGPIRGPVSIGQNLDGRLEVFAVDASSLSLKHLWQTDVREGWSGWAGLGRALKPGVAVGRNRDGRLELFGLDATNGTVLHAWQTVPNGVSSWSAWSTLGPSGMLPGLAVAPDNEDRLAVFGVSNEGDVRYACQLGTNHEAGWSAWRSLGGRFQAGIGVGQNGDGRLEVFAVGDDGRLRHCFQKHAGLSTEPTGWSSWADMGLAAQPAPAVARNQDGTLEIFAMNATNNAVVFRRRQVLGNQQWLGWSDMEHATIQYISRSWQTADGLPHHDVQAIAQTHDGYLWVGTPDGLARFDGVQFAVFNTRNTPALTNCCVTALCVDRRGVLWIGTHGGGLVRLEEGLFSRLDHRQGLAGDDVLALYESEDGALWVGTTAGASRYRDGKFATYARSEGLPSDIVASIGGSRAGHVWIATEEGLVRWTEQKMDQFTVRDGLPHNTVRSICRDRRGQVWIGSNGGVIACTRGESYSFYTYNVQHGLSDNYVSAICSDQQGNLWVGTHGGLNRLREGRLFGELTGEGLPYDKVNAIFEDREGNLWVGSRDGLTRLTPKRFFLYTNRQGLTHNNITSVREDEAGSLWIGTWNGGLNQLKDDRVKAYTAAAGLSQDLVLSTCEGRDASLWVGSARGGLTRLQDGNSTHYGQKDGLPDAAINVVHEDRAGHLWLGTSQGVSCFQGTGFTNFNADDNLPAGAVRAICEDYLGRLWFGTEKGLSRWHNGRFASFTMADHCAHHGVNALYQDRDHNLWVGTDGGGLNRIRLADAARDQQASAYSTRQGLFSDEIFEILEDDYGWLWMSCSRGVFRVHKTDFDALDGKKKKVLTSIAYGKSDGMESTLCNGVGKPAGWKSRDGRLWFPTSKGLIAIVPDLHLPQAPPPVFIEQCLADKSLVSDSTGRRSSGDAPLTRSIARPLVVSPGRGELEFHYTALNLQTPEKCLFKYMLEGVDSDWVEAGTRRGAHYSSVPPGRYCFRVTACNSDGAWNETGAALPVLLQPHLYQTWPFRALVVLGMLGSVGGLARYVTQQRLQRRLKLLQQQNAIEKERGRIAKDIHDDLGSSLTRIMMLGERTQEKDARPEELGVHTGKIVACARAAVQALDEIVWAVDPENDTVDGLVGYLNQYVNQFFESTDIRCRLEIPPRLPPLILSAEIRHDLFLVIKEALHNVLKHARATEVRVRVTETDATVEIAIEDNGCGFDASAPGAVPAGNGLQNMRQRMASLGGGFELVTAPAAGTKLKFVVKAHPEPS